jgi:phenylalanine-4-hydroxylase
MRQDHWKPAPASSAAPLDTHRVSLLTEISNAPGSLGELLRYFWKYDIDLTHIASRPSPRGSDSFHIHIDFEGKLGDENVDKLMKAIKPRCINMLVIDEKEVPWFPRHISDLDLIANRILDAGTELNADHPGFHDKVYRARRDEMAQLAKNFRDGDQIPYIEYTADENKTWGMVYDRLGEVQRQYACEEYLNILPLMEKHCGYSNTSIPQVRDISKFLYERTRFRIRPVAGLLSSRDFLNGLAFRCFFSTQYLRHSSKPLYTPEPDICHALLGHAPMFADPDFADFSQEIGLASLGASDADIVKLATCYWHSVEFGLVKGKDGSHKAYGAGLLSSFGELEYACSPNRPAGGVMERPVIRPWDPNVACSAAFPITTYQPTYFLAESLSDAKEQMRKFCETLPKPFHARFNHNSNSVWVDRAVKSSTDPTKEAAYDPAYKIDKK